MRYFLAIVALLSVAAPLTAAADNEIGVILPLTGDFGYFGEETRMGMMVAVDEAKAAGGAVPSLVFEDDKCLAKDAVTAFKRLVEQRKVALVIGPPCSTSIQSVAPIAKRSPAKVLFLLDSGPAVAAFPDPLYSLGFDPSKMARSLADDLADRKLTRVSLITEEEEYAQLISASFKEQWHARGGTIAGETTHLLGERDFRPNILRALQSKPDAVLFSAAYESGSFLKQFRTVAPELPVYGNDTMCVAATVDAAGPHANGARCGNVILDESLPRVKKFRAAIEKISGGKAPSSLFYAALGYDSVHIAAAILGQPAPPGEPLLGATTRRPDGMYEVQPTVLEIVNGTMKPIAPAQ